MAQLNSFTDLQNFLNSFCQNNGVAISSARHAAFWSTMSYQDFITGVVPNVTVPNTNPPQTLPILNKISGKYDGPSSNIVMALAGTTGSLFDPNTGSIGQMAQGGPYMSCDQILEISDWITRQCPE